MSDDEHGSSPQDNGKRRRVVRRFCSCCRSMFLSVAERCAAEAASGRLDIGITRSRDRTCKYTGVSSRSYSRLMASESCPSPGEQEERERGMSMSHEDLLFIRPALAQLVSSKRCVTLSSWREEVKALAAEEGCEWEWSRATLHRALQYFGITYQKRQRSYYTRLREEDHNIVKRTAYLKQYFAYHNEGRPFIYMDESWLNKNMVSLLPRGIACAALSAFISILTF